MTKEEYINLKSKIDKNINFNKIDIKINEIKPFKLIIINGYKTEYPNIQLSFDSIERAREYAKDYLEKYIFDDWIPTYLPLDKDYICLMSYDDYEKKYEGNKSNIKFSDDEFGGFIILY